jgi:hypothetical protein
VYLGDGPVQIRRTLQDPARQARLQSDRRQAVPQDIVQVAGHSRAFLGHRESPNLIAGQLQFVGFTREPTRREDRDGQHGHDHAALEIRQAVLDSCGDEHCGRCGQAVRESDEGREQQQRDNNGICQIGEVVRVHDHREHNGKNRAYDDIGDTGAARCAHPVPQSRHVRNRVHHHGDRHSHPLPRGERAVEHVHDRLGQEEQEHTRKQRHHQRSTPRPPLRLRPFPE